MCTYLNRHCKKILTNHSGPIKVTRPKIASNTTERAIKIYYLRPTILIGIF